LRNYPSIVMAAVRVVAGRAGTKLAAVAVVKVAATVAVMVVVVKVVIVVIVMAVMAAVKMARTVAVVVIVIAVKVAGTVRAVARTVAVVMAVMIVVAVMVIGKVAGTVVMAAVMAVVVNVVGISVGVKVALAAVAEGARFAVMTAGAVAVKPCPLMRTTNGKRRRASWPELLRDTTSRGKFSSSTCRYKPKEGRKCTPHATPTTHTTQHAHNTHTHTYTVQRTRRKGESSARLVLRKSSKCVTICYDSLRQIPQINC